MNFITINHTDNADFISRVESIIKDRIFNWKPQNIFVSRVDNWFDEKWLKFSGTLMYEIVITKLIELTIPPFHPNKIESCDKYIRQKDKYLKSVLEKPLHIFQASNDNLKRKIADFSDNGIFIWYSSRSKINNNGSLMIYYVCDDECFAFYASLTFERNWNVNKSAGMTKKDIDQIINGITEENS